MAWGGEGLPGQGRAKWVPSFTVHSCLQPLEVGTLLPTSLQDLIPGRLAPAPSC